MALTNGLVEQFDSTAVDDNGNAVSRFWTSGWQRFPEMGWLHGISIMAKRDHRVELTIDVATNFEETWRNAQRFKLVGGKATDRYVKINCPMLPPVLVSSANVRIRIKHLITGAESEIMAIGFELAIAKETDEIIPRGQ